MRKLCFLTLVAASMMLAAGWSTRPALGQSPTPIDATTSAEDMGDEGCDEGCDSRGGLFGRKGGGCGEDGCGKDGCGHGSGRNANRWFNCNCNGSYKFPVPPLYTYHWPGLYSMKRMTDYHSPWRFPAIKPYAEETPVRDLSRNPEFRQASADMDVRASDAHLREARMSQTISRYYDAQ